MKRLLQITFLGAALALGANAVQAQHFVKVEPRATVIDRGTAPSANHIWVGAEWSWSNGQYVEVPAHWALPRRGYTAWVDGHWVRSRRGTYWVKGHWA